MRCDCRIDKPSCWVVSTIIHSYGSTELFHGSSQIVVDLCKWNVSFPGRITSTVSYWTVLARAFMRAQFERIFRYLEWCKSLIAQEFISLLIYYMAGKITKQRAITGKLRSGLLCPVYHSYSKLIGHFVAYSSSWESPDSSCCYLALCSVQGPDGTATCI